MLDDNARQAAAATLLEAERTRKPAPKLSDTYGSLEIDDSYAIQQLVISDKLKRGASVRGHKIGLTEVAPQI